MTSLVESCPFKIFKLQCLESYIHEANKTNAETRKNNFNRKGERLKVDVPVGSTHFQYCINRCFASVFYGVSHSVAGLFWTATC